MRVLNSLALLLAASATSVVAISPYHELHAKYGKRPQPKQVLPRQAAEKKSRPASKYLTNLTAPFAVDGTALPKVDFDLGESYAGTLPISTNANDTNRLWFWFFPSENPLAEKEITIWLNGGPGCSSLDGLFQENGPFTWQPGTYAPIPNPYSWTNLTNMIWIDQPVSTGFSPGNILVNDEIDVGNQFAAFWKNFIDTFNMRGYKIYIAGESYAGQYIPYIASNFLDRNDTTYYNVKGIQINSPSMNDFSASSQVPVTAAAQYYQNVLNLNETFLADITKRAKSCGYTDFLEKALVFPPKGPLPTAPSDREQVCDIWDEFYNAIYFVNPCFNIYHLTDFCPFLWSEIGFPSLAGGPNNYFNLQKVKRAIHAPEDINFFICTGGPNLFPNNDQSLPSALGPLPSVIERTNNVLIGHGLLDFLIFANGSLITIQNMTWNGLQGFQKAPSATQNFFVPYHQSLDTIISVINNPDVSVHPQYDTAGAGLQGTWHTERGLTFSTVNLAGHMIPQYTPGAGYRQLEFLLGRIANLSVVGSFTTQKGDFR